MSTTPSVGGGNNVVIGLAGSLNKGTQASLAQQVKTLAHSGAIPDGANDHWRAYVNHHADQFMPDLGKRDFRTNVATDVGDKAFADDATLGAAIQSRAEQRAGDARSAALQAINEAIQNVSNPKAKEELRQVKAKLAAADTVQEQRVAAREAREALGTSDQGSTDGTNGNTGTNGGDGPNNDNTNNDTGQDTPLLAQQVARLHQTYAQQRREATAAIQAYNTYKATHPSTDSQLSHLAELDSTMRTEMDQRDSAFDVWFAAKQRLEDARGQ